MINPPTNSNTGPGELLKNFQTGVGCEPGEVSLWAGTEDDWLIVLDDWTVEGAFISIGVDVS